MSEAIRADIIRVADPSQYEKPRTRIQRKEWVYFDLRQGFFPAKRKGGDFASLHLQSYFVYSSPLVWMPHWQRPIIADESLTDDIANCSGTGTGVHYGELAACYRPLLDSRKSVVWRPTGNRLREVKMSDNNPWTLRQDQGFLRDGHRFFCGTRLPLNFFESAYRYHNTGSTHEKQENVRDVLRRKQTVEVAFRVLWGGIGIWGGAVLIYYGDRRGRWQNKLVFWVGMFLLVTGMGALTTPIYWLADEEGETEYGTYIQHDGESVQQKALTLCSSCFTVIT